MKLKVLLLERATPWRSVSFPSWNCICVLEEDSTIEQ